MSKQPKTGTAMMSRLRRPAGRLRDMPIWSKLGIIMIVPTIATIVVGTNGLLGHLQTYSNADRARTLSQLSKDVGVLVHQLQDERSSALMILSTPNGQPADVTIAAYRKQFTPTDNAQRAYGLRRTGLADLPSSFRSLLRSLDNQLSGLPAIREKVAARKDVSLQDTIFYYKALVSDMLRIRDFSAQLAGETTLSDRMRAAGAVSSMKEFLAQERAVMLRALGEGSFPAARAREFIAATTGQEQALQNFRAVATPEEQSLYDKEIASDTVHQAEKYAAEIEKILTTGNLGALHFTAAQWDTALRDRANLLRTVETTLDTQMEAQATDLRDSVVRQVLIETGLLLAMLLLAILLAWLVARSMARSLRELRHGALSVAQYGLPQAVARLRDPMLATQMSPAQVATQIAEPLPVRSRDEFGQVTEAFNAVHMEAVRTAAEQAALRSSVATMFVNLARRSQILVDRLIGHLDRLERGEEDPDQLAELFQLDHLATRMRRNDENLLVLAGADSTRMQREPAALLDVLRAAQSEVEHYTRIEFGVIDRDIEVAAHAVNDMVHLVAELLDNATAFSPPDSAVIVEARRLGDRAVLLVEDQGIGISPDQLVELNERLATPPMVDVAVSRMMGLVVVARLAARHGVKVELRPARQRGTVGDVTLPPSVLVPRALTGRLGGFRDFPPMRQQPDEAPRLAFGTPLALESGPSAAPQPAEPSPSPEPAFRAFDNRPVDAGAHPGGTGPGGSRGLPAWSDLTGVTGVKGTDGTPSGPGAPSGPDGSSGSGGRGLGGFAGPGGLTSSGGPLPQRRPGEHRTVDGEVAGPPLIPRQVPGSPEGRTNGYTPGVDDRATPPVSGPPVTAPPAPYAPPPMPTSAAPVSVPPAMAPPPSLEELARAAGTAPPRAPGRPESAPPVWPPVASPTDAGGEPPADGTGQAADDAADGTAGTAPAVPGELVAALDMTAEIPTVKPGSEADPAGSGTAPAGGTGAPAGGARPAAAVPYGGSAPRSAGSMASTGSAARGAVAPDPRSARFADETMELPIFRALESAWFQTRRSVPEPAAAPVAVDPATAEMTAAGGSSVINSSTPAGMSRPVAPGAGTPSGQSVPAQAGSPWQTAADDGWRAASAAADISVTETTEAGLPKRVPMAQLVPGGVDKSASTIQRRTPEAVRGLLSAYHRGVQRGRTQQPTGNEPEGSESTSKDSNKPEPTPAGPQSSQAGKEQEA